MFTLPEFSGYVEQLYQDVKKSRLTQKALETLAIIAYKITIAGRAQSPGSPFLYKTTKKFLDYFGLNALSDLPKLKEIDELIDVEGESRPYHETLLKEIEPDELGMKANENGEINNESNGEEDSAHENQA